MADMSALLPMKDTPNVDENNNQDISVHQCSKSPVLNFSFFSCVFGLCFLAIPGIYKKSQLLTIILRTTGCILLLPILIFFFAIYQYLFPRKPIVDKDELSRMSVEFQ